MGITVIEQAANANVLIPIGSIRIPDFAKLVQGDNERRVFIPLVRRLPRARKPVDVYEVIPERKNIPSDTLKVSLEKKMLGVSLFAAAAVKFWRSHGDNELFGGAGQRNLRWRGVSGFGKLVPLYVI